MKALVIPPLATPPDWVREAVKIGLKRAGYHPKNEAHRENMVMNMAEVMEALRPKDGELCWGKEAPRVAGYYWMQAPNFAARVVHFYPVAGQRSLTCDYFMLRTNPGHLFEYAGPIPTPL